MTERYSVRLGDTTIEYNVRRSERRKKTVQITVDGGGVQVAAPSTTPYGELRAIVRKRASWILSHASGAMLEAAPKRFVSGETLPYLGRNVRMVFEPADVRSPEVRFDHWRFRVAVPQSIEDRERCESIRRAIVRWYRARATERLRGQRRPLVAQARSGREVAGAHPRPAPTLGELRPRRHAALQLADDDASASAHRVRRRPRVSPPDPSEPLDGLLGPDDQGNTRCPA